MTFTSTTGLIFFVEAQAQKEEINTIIFYFIDGSVAVWDETPDMIKGRLYGMDNIVTFGCGVGKLIYYAYFVGNELNIYVMYDMGV